MNTEFVNSISNTIKDAEEYMGINQKGNTTIEYLVQNSLVIKSWNADFKIYRDSINGLWHYNDKSFISTSAVYKIIANYVLNKSDTDCHINGIFFEEKGAGLIVELNTTDEYLVGPNNTYLFYHIDIPTANYLNSKY